MEEIKPSRLWANLLGISGALVGLSTLFLPWFTTIGQVVGSQPIDRGLIDSMSSFIMRYDPVSFSSCIFFLIGLAIAFVSPIGGYVQTFSILIFIGWQSTSWSEGATLIWTGPLLGLLSGIMGIAAFIKPIGIGFMNETKNALPRFLNIGLHKK